MKQMYVIIARGGSYDDAWERAEFVTDDKTKGDEYVAAMNKLAAEVIDGHGHIEKHMQHWRVDNPCPAPLLFVELAVPSFSGIGNKNITKEMRDNRDNIRNQNMRMAAESQEPVNKWYKSQHEAREQFIEVTFPAPVKEGMERGYFNTSWTIEPIAWLE